MASAAILNAHDANACHQAHVNQRITTMKTFDEMDAEQESTFASLRAGKCGCHACIKGRGEIAIHMVVCRTCGNKRCPKASDHNLDCTNSNESGQPGSIYA